MSNNIQDTNNISELQSHFEQLREVDADGKEWWKSLPSMSNDERRRYTKN